MSQSTDNTMQTPSSQAKQKNRLAYSFPACSRSSSLSIADSSPLSASSAALAVPFAAAAAVEAAAATSASGVPFSSVSSTASSAFDLPLSADAFLIDASPFFDLIEEEDAFLGGAKMEATFRAGLAFFAPPVL